MTLLEQLQKNKGCVSSALGKSLADKVLKGNTVILKEAIGLLKFGDKNVRAGAAKIIEQVAVKKPDLVAKNIEGLWYGLDAEEPQTRWMITHTLGLCAHLNPAIVKKAMAKTESFLKEGSLRLKDSVITYLGYLGAVSTKEAKEIFPKLEKTLISVPERITRVLAGFERMVPVLEKKKRKS